VLLTELSDGDDADEIIKRLVGVAAEPIPFGEVGLEARVSIGAALAASEDDATSLLERSDRELYDSKRA